MAINKPKATTIAPIPVAVNAAANALAPAAAAVSPIPTAINDLDKNVLEVYEGFNQKPLTIEDRFFHLTDKESEYHPIKLVKSYQLNNLPLEDEFLNDFKQEQEN